MNQLYNELNEFCRQSKDRQERRQIIDSIRKCIDERIVVMQAKSGALSREAVELYTIDIINALLVDLEKEVDFDESMMRSSLAIAVELASEGRLKSQSDEILRKGQPRS